MKYINGTRLSQVGMGTTCFWYGNTRKAENTILKAIREYGMNVIDTAEMYGYGRCEEALGDIIKKCDRQKLCIVDKILPSNCTRRSFEHSLNKSLERLGTDYIDYYLLHWRENVDLVFLVQAMEQAVREGKILHWGVSNFDTDDMKDLLQIRNGDHCAANQILYNPLSRGPEYDLLPYLRKHHILAMSYSSLGISYANRKQFTNNPAIRKIAAKEHVSPEGIMLAFNVRSNDLCAFFSTTSPDHLDQDMTWMNFDIEPYMDMINHLFPAPDHKIPLEKY